MPTYKVVNAEGHEVYSADPVHPGEILADEIAARDISQKNFAKLIGMRPPHLNELLKGKRNFTPKIALSVESTLGINASFWVRAQGEYFLDLARLEHSEKEVVKTV